jgi:hypothetical protein
VHESLGRVHGRFCSATPHSSLIQTIVCHNTRTLTLEPCTARDRLGSCPWNANADVWTAPIRDFDSLQTDQLPACEISLRNCNNAWPCFPSSGVSRWLHRSRAYMMWRYRICIPSEAASLALLHSICSQPCSEILCKFQKGCSGVKYHHYPHNVCILLNVFRRSFPCTWLA